MKNEEKVFLPFGTRVNTSYDDHTRTVVFVDGDAQKYRWAQGDCFYVNTPTGRRMMRVHFVVTSSAFESELAFVRPLTFRQKLYYLASRIGERVGIEIDIPD